MQFTILILCCVTGILLSGCGNDKNTNSPQAATGETPIRYVLCGNGDKFCFVSARFKDMESCESHKEWSISRCDKVSQPGMIICTKDPLASGAYCTL